MNVGKFTGKAMGLFLCIPGSCRWNPNWDGRMCDGYILTVNDTFTSSDMEHYNKDSEEKGLSEIGIQQADRLATHLIEIKVSPQAYLVVNPNQGCTNRSSHPQEISDGHCCIEQQVK